MTREERPPLEEPAPRTEDRETVAAGEPHSAEVRERPQDEIASPQFEPFPASWVITVPQPPGVRRRVRRDDQGQVFVGIPPAQAPITAEASLTYVYVYEVASPTGWLLTLDPLPSLATEDDW